MNKALKKSKPAYARADYARSAQDRFLSQMVEERRKVVVFLTNGIKLEGAVKSFDEYAILLDGEMTNHVYKHAVSTIQPLTAVASKADANVQQRHTPRVAAGSEAGAAEAAEVLAAGGGVLEKRGGSRQPVIVIRPKRRSVKRAASDG